MSFKNFEDLRANVLALSNNIKMIEKNSGQMEEEIWKIKNEYWGEIVKFFQRLYILADEAGINPSTLRIKCPFSTEEDLIYDVALSKNSRGYYELGLYMSSHNNPEHFKRRVVLYPSFKYTMQYEGDENKKLITFLYQNWDSLQNQIQENFFNNISALLNQKMDTVAQKSLQITQRLKDAQAKNK